jgi:ABC-type lipoprotein release transport system permease subunit
VVITLEARPVYSYLSARTFETEVDAGEMILGFALAALVCLAATFVPLRLACRRLERLER